MGMHTMARFNGENSEYAQATRKYNHNSNEERCMCMKKLFTVIRQGKLDEVKAIIEKKPELVNCVSGPLQKKDHGQSPLQVAFKTGNYEIAGYLIPHGADYRPEKQNSSSEVI